MGEDLDCCRDCVLPWFDCIRGNLDMNFIPERIWVFPSLLDTLDQELFKSYGAITQPEFLDNGFVSTGGVKAKLSRFYALLEEYRADVRFAVVPDNLIFEGLVLKQRYPHVQWIYPLHYIEDLPYIQQFSFIGFPQRQEWRNYSLSEFIKRVPYEKRWYLGFFAENTPAVLLFFLAVDTTIPSMYAKKRGKIWYSWNNARKPLQGFQSKIAMVEQNLINFRRAVQSIYAQTLLGGSG